MGKQKTNHFIAPFMRESHRLYDLAGLAGKVPQIPSRDRTAVISR